VPCDEKPAHDVTLTRGFWLGRRSDGGSYRRYAQATAKEMPPEPKLKERALNPGWRER